jgi:periplasmic protein TonB
MIPEERSDQGKPRGGPLWARLDELEDPGIPLWKAALIAAAIELLVPLLVFGVDWAFLGLTEPPPTPVMNVRLEPPPPPPPPPPPEKRKPVPEKKVEQVAVDQPPPDPNAKIQLPKPEPKPKPKPKPKKEEPPPPEPEPKKEEEPEAPPLPSVFRDVKPVRKVVPKYPPEAEAQHIEGRVRVRLSVDVDGNVTDVETLLSEPPGVFDASVQEAVRQFKFKRDGTSYKADQEIIFKIDP